MNYADNLEKIMNDAVEVQREKLFKQWCVNTELKDREILYAHSQALNSIKAEMLKTLRKETRNKV